MESAKVAVERYASKTIGAAIEVHRCLGPGYDESVYELALAAELELRKIPFQRQARFAVQYKGRLVGEGRLDFLVGGCLIVELKAVEELGIVHLAQVLTYLKATDQHLALLVNFNVHQLIAGIRRVIR
jgi:GxxExxY protein